MRFLHLMLGNSVLLVSSFFLLTGFQSGSGALSQKSSDQPLANRVFSTNLAGTVVGFGEADENEWILSTDRGQIVVDAGPRWYQTITLDTNEPVTIEGEFDAGEFDAFRITRADGTVITVRPEHGRPPWAGGPHRLTPQFNPQNRQASYSQTGPAPHRGWTTLTGTIADYGEADENEWRLQTSQGIVTVDAGPRQSQTIDLTVDEQVTVEGEFDAGEFDAFRITRADGTVIEVQSAFDDWEYEENWD